MAKVKPVVTGPCPKCITGSGKDAGHAGRHAERAVSAKKKRDEECDACVPGSGKMSGHRGRHASNVPAKKKPKLAPEAECNKCVVGSGNSKHHRGRHKTIPVKSHFAAASHTHAHSPHARTCVAH